MAKGARSKYKKRVRSAKASHHYEISGKQTLARITNRLNDPTFQMANEYTMPINAYLEPDNPLAVFPQVKKPQILDFRCHKIALGAQACIGTFRKHLGNSKKSKYVTIVKSREQLDAEEAGLEAAMDEGADAAEATVVKSEPATKETMDELAKMTEQMTLEKKNRRRSAKKADADMDGGPQIKI